MNNLIYGNCGHGHVNNNFISMCCIIAGVFILREAFQFHHHSQILKTVSETYSFMYNPYLMNCVQQLPSHVYSSQ